MDKHITPFKAHIDNIKEVVSAKDINKIQEVINDVQRQHIQLADGQFRHQAFLALESSNFANSMFLDELETPYKVLLAKSSNVVFDKEESCVKVIQSGNIREGEMLTVKMSSQYPTVINEFSLLVDHHIPRGAAIRYFISNDGTSFYPIKPNVSEATVLKYKNNEIFLKAQLIKNKDFESPKIYGFCILYRDPVVDKMYGLDDIDLSRLDSTIVGETILFRDNENGDRLKIIIDPSSMTELHYDSVDSNGEERVSHIITRTEDRITKDLMNYGPYINSEGIEEDVLISITTSLEHPEDVGKMGD